MTRTELENKLKELFVGTTYSYYSMWGVKDALKKIIDDCISSNSNGLLTYTIEGAYNCSVTALLEHSRDIHRPLTQVARASIKRKKNGREYEIKDIEVSLYGGKATVEDALSGVEDHLNEENVKFEDFVSTTTRELMEIIDKSGVGYERVTELVRDEYYLPYEEIEKLKNYKK